MTRSLATRSRPWVPWVPPPCPQILPHSSRLSESAMLHLSSVPRVFLVLGWWPCLIQESRGCTCLHRLALRVTSCVLGPRTLYLPSSDHEARVPVSCWVPCPLTCQGLCEHRQALKCPPLTPRPLRGPPFLCSSSGQNILKSSAEPGPEGNCRTPARACKPLFVFNEVKFADLKPTFPREKLGGI